MVGTQQRPRVPTAPTLAEAYLYQRARVRKGFLDHDGTWRLFDGTVVGICDDLLDEDGTPLTEIHYTVWCVWWLVGAAGEGWGGDVGATSWAKGRAGGGRARQRLVACLLGQWQHVRD